MSAEHERLLRSAYAAFNARDETTQSNVEPQSFSADAEGRVVVAVHQVVRDSAGALIADRTVEHVYTLRDGLVERMDVRD